MRTLTSIQSCCRTPGNQETTSKMAHRISGAASLFFCTQSYSSGTVCIAPCLLDEPAQCALACAMWPVLAPPYLQQKGWNGCVARDCSHMSPSLPFLRAHADRRPASGVAPSRNAVAILHCAFCGSSVGDLSMAVQHVPVPGAPALSMMACCSESISLCSFARLILDCSLANAMSRARLFGGDPVCRLDRNPANDLRRSLVRHPRACLGCSSTATPDKGRSVFAARAAAISGCTSRIGLFSASLMFVKTVLCRSTADQYAACAAKPI